MLEDEFGRLSVGDVPSGFVARYMESQKFETVVAVRADSVNAAVAFSDAIARLGRLLDDGPSEPDGTISGVIGGGISNKNPAVVQVRIAPEAEGRCRATLTGTAKEGVIKQRTAERAVKRLLGDPAIAGVCGPEART